MTDLTRNTKLMGLRPVTADWCPSNLAPVILQVEFYGIEASNFVRSKEMAKDQIWTLCNVRLKENKVDGYLEGSFMEVRKAYRYKEGDKPNVFVKDLLAYVILSL